MSMRHASVSLAAVTENVRVLVAVAGEGVSSLAVVKADGYGHGAVPIARAALRGGATALGVADVQEAEALRAGGIDAPILAWLPADDAAYEWAVRHDVSLGVSGRDQADAVIAAGRRAGRVPRVHVKVDTGLNRNGVARSERHELFAHLANAERAREVDVSGVFSHLANASVADDDRAAARFAEVVAELGERGIRPRWRHLAASAAGLTRSFAGTNMVRWGISVYGVSPDGEIDVASRGLRPAMSLSSRVVRIDRIRRGEGVSYDYAYRAPADTTIALVPLGYADGMPRAAWRRGSVVVSGRRCAIAGRIAMDQFVVECPDDTRLGDRVDVFGDPRRGEPDVWSLARDAETIAYDVLTGIRGRVHVTYPGDDSTTGRKTP